MRSLTYSLVFLTGLARLVASTPYPQYGPLTDEDGASLEARAPDAAVCKAVKVLVEMLKVQKATPFCRSFLNIQTTTVEAFSTESVDATITVTSTTSETTTTTVETDTITHTETTTIATLPTVVETIVVPEASISTFTTTPASATVTTTVYTTPGAAKVKRDALPENNIEERKVELPGYLKAFGSSAVSKACSCLNLPTPTTTSTSIVTATYTETANALTTDVKVVSVTATTDLTITKSVTDYVPTTTYTTSVSVSVTTVTAETPTHTVTINKPYNSHCINVLSGYKIFLNVQVNRQFAYPFATTPITGGGGEESYSQCCQLCHDSINCGFYYVYAASPGNYRCQIITAYTQVNQNISPQCPLGILPGAGFSNPVNQWSSSQPRGIGPCYVLPDQLP